VLAEIIVSLTKDQVVLDLLIRLKRCDMVKFRGKRVLSVVAVLVLNLYGCATQPTSDPASQAEAEARYQQAVNLARSGKQMKALEAASQAVSLDPRNAKAHELAALMNQQADRQEKAAISFKQALALNPSSPSLLNNYGNFQCQRKNFAAATELFNRAAAIQTNPKPEIAYTNAGLCALRAGDTPQAKQLLTQAIEVRADQSVAVYQLAQIALAENDSLVANSWLEQYLRHFPHTAKTLLLGANIENQLGNPLGVSDYTDKLLSGFPNSAEATQAKQLGNPVSGAQHFAAGTTYDSSWVKNRNPTHFTVQIATSKKKQELDELIKLLPATENAIFIINPDGRPRFNLIAGNYSDFEDAQAAMLAVKKQLPTRRPWVRNFAGIQANL